MSALMRILPGLLTLGLFLSSCGGKGSESTRPKPLVIPDATPLAVGIAFTDTLDSGESRYFHASLGAAPGHVALLHSIGGATSFMSYGGDSTFQHLDYLSPSDTSLIRQCSHRNETGHWYLEVRGSQSPTRARYSLLVYPVVPGSGTPVSQGASFAPVAIEAGVPFAGQVGTRSSSYYRVHGLAPGVRHSVLLFSLTGDVDLYTVGCPSPHYASSISLEPMECSGVTDSTTDIHVECGPLNRDGARYWAWVR